MVKKIITTIIIALMISTVAIQHAPHAQEVGVSDILFVETTSPIMIHGFAIDEIGYGAIKLHLLIANKNVQNIEYQGEILQTLKTLEELTKKDVIDMLDIATEKEKTLHEYLIHCFQELQKGESILAYMKQEMNIIKWDMDACLTDKSLSDKEYFNAIEEYDQEMMDKALTDSLRYETCATQNRIAYNAKVTLARKLTFYLWTLQKKYDLLEEKQDIVANNFTVFRDNILPDLNQIDELLKQYDF